MQNLHALCISEYYWSETEQFWYTCPLSDGDSYTLDYEGIVTAAKKVEAEWNREAMKGKSAWTSPLPTINVWGMKKPCSSW
jgi:hypothetical protein